MGSELADADGRVLWGLADPRWYVSAWTSGTSLRALRLSEDERAGRYGRVRATRLLQFPAFAPVLAGLAPYASLVQALRSASCHPDAVQPFPYDWRLPTAHNGRLLAEAAVRHLESWRGRAEQEAARRIDPDGDRPARLVLVAHSMGGLLARQACAVPGFAEMVRAIVTLGTPFFGAPKAVVMLGAGRGIPLPRVRARSLAACLPGVHDLLPVYRCVRDGAGARRLTASDVAGLGGEKDLAAAALAWQDSVADITLPGHVQVVGAFQPTVQSVTLDGGIVTGHRYSPQLSAAGVQHVDFGGDGTVPRHAAELPAGPPVMPLAQAHGALAVSSEASVIVRDVLTGRRTGSWQGTGELGLDMPDVVIADRPWTVTITGVQRAVDISCSVVDVRTGLRVAAPAVRTADGGMAARAEPLPQGLFWVQADSGGMSPVRQMVMSVGPAALDGD